MAAIPLCAGKYSLKKNDHISTLTIEEEVKGRALYKFIDVYSSPMETRVFDP